MILPNRKLLLANLDLEVENTSRRMMDQMEDACAMIQMTCDAALNRLPKEIRNMTVEEFCLKYKGNVSNYLNNRGGGHSEAPSKALGNNFNSSASGIKPQALSSSTINTLSHKLPETPATVTRKPRQPRKNESLISVNGSPLANPWVQQLQDNEEEEEEFEGANVTFAHIPTALSKLDLQPKPAQTNTNRVIQVGKVPLIQLQLTDGTRVSVDPSASPAELQAFTEMQKKEIAAGMKAHFNAMAKFLSNLS